MESVRRSAPRGGRIRSESAADFVGIRKKRDFGRTIAEAEHVIEKEVL